MERPTWITAPDFWTGFRSYSAEDVHYVLTALGATHRERHPDFITDYFGMRISADSDPMQAHRIGEAIDRIPFPTDTLFGEGIEYAALSLSLRSAGPSYDIVELGAGFGPFVTIGTICARRLARMPIRITAVEADPARFELMRQHLADNGLVPRAAPDAGAARDFSWSLHNAIAWPRSDQAYWPSGTTDDAGRQASADPMALDYRGRECASQRLATLSLATILTPHSKVDLMHCDIQGAEAELLFSDVETLRQKVRRIFVATHSREIEGRILARFYEEGWTLEREEPCAFRYDRTLPTLQAMTFRDGGQVWRNPMLASELLD
jgi:FkbM family methyltransferase